MFDTIDEYMLQSFTKYKDFQLISVYHEKIIDYLPIMRLEHPDEHHRLLLSKFRNALSEKVENVIISNRLVSSPSCMVSSKDGWTPNMERIMKAQALGGDSYKNFIGNQKIMELNINHPIIQKISKSLRNKEVSSEIEKNIHLLYNISCLSSGFTVDSLPLLCQYLYQTIDLESSSEDKTEIFENKISSILGKQNY
jgi:HSP90 family molecular chaperone